MITDAQLRWDSIHYLDVMCALSGDPAGIFAALSQAPGEREQGGSRGISMLVFDGDRQASEGNLGTLALVEARYRSADTDETQIPERA